MGTRCLVSASGEQAISLVEAASCVHANTHALKQNTPDERSRSRVQSGPQSNNWIYDRVRFRVSELEELRQVVHVGRELPVSVTLAAVLERSFPAEYAERRAELSGARAAGDARAAPLPLFVMSSVLPGARARARAAARLPRGRRWGVGLAGRRRATWRWKPGLAMTRYGCCDFPTLCRLRHEARCCCRAL